MAPDPTLTDKTLRNDATASSENARVASNNTTFLGYLREWSDALVIAFVVAMFIRMFVVELFKIPSGSMSPTLLGDFVAEGIATDRQGENHQYLLISDPTGEVIQVFEKQDDGYFDYQGKQSRMSLTSSQQVLLESEVHREEHRILVNKFAYWFSEPERGDIVIFRVPFGAEPEAYGSDGMIVPQYERDQSVYVKRTVALEGEQLSIGDESHLYINGEQVTVPEILAKLQYISPDRLLGYDINVPDEHVVVFGDNSDNSLDSRYWGPLPERNLRGKAILRYWPFKDKWFLSPK